MNPDNIERSFLALKLAAIWSLVGVSNMEEAATLASLVAACLASVYTCLLIFQWFIKNFWTPLFIRLGWFGFKRRILTLEEAAREADE